MREATRGPGQDAPALLVPHTPRDPTGTYGERAFSRRDPELRLEAFPEVMC
ncbi:MAG: hypothetical protein AVDCRST_MAG22-983 [uncultured Rubrobacteraceae bacterium]|uniref:Uncharacterized protein n=1 Tax=uncultured Rubrobacteraceae bacterium TaxID=349277 RepID=A0A6J4P1F9_9ACTN|nr:MAG: hypothetical protein AVDCRST_MAG22-983 [uncultured Rubrobacteraceae bacterium]